MSKREELENKIFGDVLVLEFEREENSHALWKCLCMLCNDIMYVTTSNLKSGNTKSCGSCCKRKTNYKQECEIIKRLQFGEKKTNIAKEFGVSRHVVYRIVRENKNTINCNKKDI